MEFRKTNIKVKGISFIEIWCRADLKMYLVWWEEDVHDLVVGLAHVVGVQRVHLLKVLPKVDDEPAANNVFFFNLDLSFTRL